MVDRELVERLDRAIDALLTGPWAPAAVDQDVAPLAVVAGLLRALPSAEFKTRLKAELGGSVAMTDGVDVRAAFKTVSPFIIHERAPELVEFLKRAFDAKELRRDTTVTAYGFYSEMRIGDSVLMIGGGSSAEHGNVPGSFHVFVDDCDAAYARSIASGAKTLAGALGEPADRPYGERSAFVQDAFGNYWYIATSLQPGAASDPPGGDLGSVRPFLHPSAVRKYIAFLNEAFGAGEVAVVEHGGRVMHASARIGDAVLEMGEPEDRSGIPSGGFFVRVEDVDAAYARALAAGATAVRPPADIPYGYRSAIVRDAEGYLWWPARLMTR
jgi:PhnB protein